MTTTLESLRSADAAVPGGRRRRKTVVLTLIVVLVVGIGVALWVLVPGLVAISGTTVLLDAKPFTCATAADVTTFDMSDGSDPQQALLVPAVRLHPGLDCVMAVVVRNDSDADVSVDSVTIPLAGPANGIGIRADHAQTQGIDAAGGRDATDATFDYADDPNSGGAFAVPAHSVQRFDIHLAWSDGCMGNGSSASFTSAPTVVLSAGPWALAKSGDGAGYAFLGGKDTSSAACSARTVPTR